MNNPLIGITSWRAIAGREIFEISADDDDIGVMTRKPVVYNPGLITPALDENHSHFIFIDGECMQITVSYLTVSRFKFLSRPRWPTYPPSPTATATTIPSLSLSLPLCLRIPSLPLPRISFLALLVSTVAQANSHCSSIADGSVGRADGDIELRALLESCARLPDGNSEQMKVLRLLNRMQIGWEGAQDRWSVTGVSNGLAGAMGDDRNYSVCICFGGGQRAVAAAVAAIKASTPLLLVRGSGGAADLIADGYRIFWSEDAQDEDNGGSDETRTSASVDKNAVSNTLCIKKFVLSMVQIKDHALAKRTGTNFDWPRSTSRAPSTLLQRYKIPLPTACDLNCVLGVLCEIFGCISSPLCHVYDMKMRNSDDSLADFKDAALDCVARSLEVEAQSKSLRKFFHWWRHEKSVEGGKFERDIILDNTNGSSDEGGGVLHKVKYQIDQAKELQFNLLKLAIEWDDRDSVRNMLTGFEAERLCWDNILQERKEMHSNTQLLNKCLHLALVQESCEIATVLLHRGADLTLYADNTAGVWKDVLVSACNLPDNRYLRRLLHKGWQGLGNPENTLNTDSTSGEITASGMNSNENEHATNAGISMKFIAKDIVDDAQAKSILNVIFNLLLGYDPGSPQKYRFASSSVHTQLSLCLLLTGRTKLAALFLLQDFRHNATPLFQNALLACMVCRALTALPDHRQYHHLKEIFIQADDDFEKCATTILNIADKKNSTATLRALEQPMLHCDALSAVELIYKADCRALVQDCTDPCEEAVQRRFSGDGRADLVLLRYNRKLVQLLKEGTAAHQPKLYMLNKWIRLLMCVFIDVAGFVIYSRFAALFQPIFSFLIYHTLGNALLSVASLAKMCLPYGQWIPVATMAWIYSWCNNHSQGDNEEAELEEKLESDILPVDLYVFDVLAHLMHACLFTAFF